ncbi:hypothetical protein D3C86_1149660 [compost metagenome]
MRAMWTRFIDAVLDYRHRFAKQKRYYHTGRGTADAKLIGLLRIRNESLIIQDTLDHLSTFCDGVLCYDDASTDETLEIIRNHPAVWGIIRNYAWKQTIDERLDCETQDRLALLNFARTFNPEWVMCADADERFVGDIRGFLTSPASNHADAVRIQLLDAYMTPDDHRPYQKGDSLLNFRKKFGIEQRNILMLWRCNENFSYVGQDQREPTIVQGEPRIVTEFHCQHYGKAISIQQWEETCDYYVKYFPFETYGKKWQARKGKAIHEQSDFETELHDWPEVLKHGKQIHPPVVNPTLTS